jgi:hypothetical protein
MVNKLIIGSEQRRCQLCRRWVPASMWDNYRMDIGEYSVVGECDWYTWHLYSPDCKDSYYTEWNGICHQFCPVDNVWVDA